MAKYKTFNEMFNDDKVVSPILREEINKEVTLIGKEIEAKETKMEYKGYHATINYDTDDNIFIGEVSGIKDSLNFHGETLSELEDAFKQSIDNYLKCCKETGKEPEIPEYFKIK